jgi:hypothetical protein
MARPLRLPGSDMREFGGSARARARLYEKNLTFSAAAAEEDDATAKPQGFAEKLTGLRGRIATCRC